MSTTSRQEAPNPPGRRLVESRFSLPRFMRQDRWEIWRLPRALRVYVLSVEFAAILTTAFLILRHHIAYRDLLVAGCFVALGVLKEELTRTVERMRRRASETPHQNMTSVWTLAAALLLPAGMAVVVVVALYTHLWLRTWRPVRGVRAWKVVFSVSAVTLSCHSAASLQLLLGPRSIAQATDWRAIALLVGVIAAYSVVNLAVVAGAIAPMTSHRTAERLFGTYDDMALETATLIIGGVAAMLFTKAPLTLVLLIPVLIVLHRNVLVRQLEKAASADPKTGLLNATAWQTLAQAELERASRDGSCGGVLMIDLDHFKWINDEHGHLVGDKVLVKVADLVRSKTREYDLVGRFGGEEFVVLCPEIKPDELVEVGNRIRSAVAKLHVELDGNVDVVHLTASIGVAHFPTSGPRLEDVLLAADNALFAAKDGGRDRVEVTEYGAASASFVSRGHQARQD